MKTSQRTAITALSIAALTAVTQAELITYDLLWTGEPFQNIASATGQVTIDTDLVPNPGEYVGPWAGSPFSNFSITIVDAVSGNGTFSTANNDFVHVIWTVGEGGEPLGPGFEIDLFAELIGQENFFDFNVFNQPFFDGESPQGGNPEAPNGTGPFVLQTSGAAAPGDFIQLVSMRPVPAPSTIAFLGLGALTATRRRR